MKKTAVLFVRAIAFAGALAACAGAVADEASLAYYLAAPDSGNAEPALGGRPAERESFDTGSGVRAIVRSAEPVLSVPASGVVEARVHAVTDSTGASARSWAVVRLGLAAPHAARIERLSARHPDLYLLMRLNETLVDMEALASAPTRGFPGGVFASLDAAREAYARADIPLRVEEPLPEAVEDRERFEREYRAAARWLAACDPESFEALRREGIERHLGAPAADASGDAADCDGPAPAFPPAPPGRPDVCAVVGENGARDGGERVGLWSAVNRYGQTLRLDRYRAGVLERSVWLRDCPGSG